MARRNPPIPGFGDIPGNGNDPWSGGDLDLSADGSRSRPAGAGTTGFTTMPMASQVQLTKDEAVAAAIEGLRSDARVWTDMNAKFTSMLNLQGQTSDHLAQLRREQANQNQDLLTAINRMADSIRSNGSGNRGNRVSTGYSPTSGDPLAGYTTSGDLTNGAVPLNPWGVPMAAANIGGYSRAPFQVSSGGVASGGSSPGAGMATRTASGATTNTTPAGSPSGRGFQNFFTGGGGGGGGGGTPLPAYNAGSGPGPGRAPNPFVNSRTGGFQIPMGLSGAISTARWAQSQFYGQRAENERFQQIEGGSNFDGFGEREHQFGFRLGHLGLSSADDNAIFQGITGFGITGGERNRLGDQVYHAKMNQGIGVDESMSALTAGARYSATGLDSVVQGLQDVTKAAKDFGENAVQVRKKFTDTLNGLAGSGLTGSAASSLATTLTTSAAAGGRAALNIDESARYSGTNQQSLVMTAASAGMSYKQMDNMRINNPAAFAAATGADTVKILEQIIGPAAVAFVKSQLAALGTQEKDGSSFDAIGRTLLTQVPLPAPVLLNVVKSRLPGISDALNLDTLGSWIVRQFDASGNPAQTQQKLLNSTTKVNAQGQLINQTTGAAATDSKGNALTTTPTTDSKTDVGISKRSGSDAQIAAVSAAGFKTKIAGVSNTSIGNLESGKYQSQTKTAASSDKAYASTLNNFKGKIPQLETLGRKYGKNLSKVMVRLSTAGGELDMSLDRAINTYPAVIAAGEATILAGTDDDNGKTIAEVLNNEVDTSQKNMADVATEQGSQAAASAALKNTSDKLGKTNAGVKDSDLQGKGKSTYKKYGLSDYYDNTQNRKDATSNVTVTLSDDAKKLLKLTGPAANSSANSGTPVTYNSDGSRSAGG